MRGFYVELAFWCSLVSALIAGAVQTLTGYPGDLISQDALLVAGIVSASLSLIAAAVLKRAS